MRFVVGLAALALVGCASADDGNEAVASDDSALSAIESELGFDGAINQLDIATLETIDAETKVLETAGHSEAQLDQAATKKTLAAVLAKRASAKEASGLRVRFDAYDNDLFKLNGLEQKLCGAHRIVCVRVAISAFKARGASQAEYRDGNVGGRIDCFRHTYWNASMARAVGVDYAKQWGDAHENGYPENRATAKDRVLSDMDFFNNDVGRKIGIAHEDDSDGDVKAAVRKAIESGDVRAVRYDLGDRNGKLVPASQCSETVRCGS